MPLLAFELCFIAAGSSRNASAVWFCTGSRLVAPEEVVTGRARFVQMNKESDNDTEVSVFVATRGMDGEAIRFAGDAGARRRAGASQRDGRAKETVLRLGWFMDDVLRWLARRPRSREDHDDLYDG